MNTSYSPVGLQIDNLRIAGKALSETQIAELRNAGGSVSTANTVSDGTTQLQAEFGDTGSGAGADMLNAEEQAILEARAGDSLTPALEYESDEAAIIAKLERDLAAERQKVSELEAELAALRAETESSSTPADNSTGTRPVPVGDPVYSNVAGLDGNTILTNEIEGFFLRSITLTDGAADLPCEYTYGVADDLMPTTTPYAGSLPGCSSYGQHWLGVNLPDSVISRLAVCGRGTGSANQISGLRVWGQYVAGDGSLSYRPSASEYFNDTCNGDWSPSVVCPADTVGTGIVVHGRTTRDGLPTITGLQLICRSVGMR
jgi:hypothetical protein